MPGSVLTVFSGWLAFQGKAPLVSVMIAAGIGAVFGDLLSYVLGARFGVRLWNLPLLKKRVGLLRISELLFFEHGGKSVFLGRFLGPIRGLVPFVAGASQMRPGTFCSYAVISCFLWGVSYPGVGFLGGTSWEHAETLAGRFGLLVALLVVVILLISWLRHKFLPRESLRKANRNRFD